MFVNVNLLLTLALAGTYGYWLYTKRQQWRTYFAPLYILGGCLLVSVLVDAAVFRWAEVVSYSAGEGWISDMKYQEPNYLGEDLALGLVLLGPLAGLALLLGRLPRGVRAGQAAHYGLLLVFVYPWVAIMLFRAVEGNKPRYYEGSVPPPVGAHLPAR